MKVCVYIFTYIDNLMNAPLEVFIVSANNAERAEQMVEEDIFNRRCKWIDSDYRRVSWMMDEHLAPVSSAEGIIYRASEAIELTRSAVKRL